MNTSQKNHKHSIWVIYGIILFIFILFCYCSPYALDDWFYGSSTGINCMNKGFSTLNGRYLSNLLEMVFSRAFIFRAFCMGSGCFFIFYFIQLIVGKDNIVLTILSAFLFLTMSRGMFKSTVIWSPGFVNFTFSALVVLITLLLFKDIFSDNPTNNFIKSIAALFLGVITCLNIENVTIYMCIVSILLLIYSGVRFHKINSSQLALLVGSVIGTVIMFTNPVYRAIADPNEEHYRDMALSLSSLIKSSYSCISEHIIPNLFKENITINIIMALLLSLLVYITNKKNLLSRLQKRLTIICNLYIILTATYFYFCNRHTDVKLLLNYTPIFEILMMIVYFISVTIILITCLQEKERRHRILFEAGSILILSAPLLVVSPVADRCFTPMYVFRMLLAADIMDVICRTDAHQLIKKRIQILTIIFTTIFLTLSICYSSIFIYIKKADIARMDSLFKQIDAGKTTVTLEKLPYSNYLFKGAIPPSNKWMNWFKDSNGIDSNIVIEIIDFDGIH